MIRAAPAVALSVMLSACATAQVEGRAERRAQLDAIAATCGLPSRMLHLTGSNELLFRPDPETSYEAVSCVIAELRKTDIPMKMGFVANYAPPEAEER